MAARKIAYLTPLYFDDRSCIGGGERYPMNMAAGIAEGSRGTYEVDLISYGDAPGRHPIRPGVTLRILKAARRPANPLDVVSWDLPGAIAEADLVHIHTAFTRASEMGILAAKQQRKPVCVSDHGGHSSLLGASLGTLEMVDRIVCYSDFGASLYRTPTPIVVIKGGVDAALFSPPADRPHRDRMLYVGRLLPHKGIDDLITAMPPDLPLTVCGRPYHPEYFERLKSLAIGKCIEFVTDADDAAIRHFYASSWANVLPSVYRDCYGNVHEAPELMGFTLLEAMACGTPAIASRVAAMPEFIREGETGFIFDDLDGLTGLLRRLASDSELVEAIGARAREVVLEEYDLTVAGARLAALYDSLISPSPQEVVA
jgi:glycosyltransferase involved in cell wall biosynthesis